ncbi:hypothetical protein BC628DRAFT_95336 [Trametes gibbosa]|nr:hypothetical protein BC628DRAFT_95336 [Trametes gibbosa]
MRVLTLASACVVGTPIPESEVKLCARFGCWVLWVMTWGVFHQALAPTERQFPKEACSTVTIVYSSCLDVLCRSVSVYVCQRWMRWQFRSACVVQ